MDPPSIHRLSTTVVSKIAAGEIIVRPANALKEMLENSIDAQATSIEIMVKDGGLKFLQITDNGHGINKDDMPLLCERFATSKLNKFEDLESIATYGFRGEALASISHIARVSVVTKTSNTSVAYKAFYTNGVMVGPNFKPLENVEPKPIAGKDGTQIVVEDLFYNIPSRLKGMRSKTEEFSRILDVVGRYAIHSARVGINFKKHGEAYLIVSTRPNLPLKERIRTVYGNGIANELLDLTLEVPNEYGLRKVVGGVTSPNYDNKKKIAPVFFINNRLVECDPLKRAVNAVHQMFLPKGNYGFTYLSVEIEPKNLDVNVHPTKREVRFLHEEQIVEMVCDGLHTLLSSVDQSRKFKVQSVLGTKRGNDDYKVSAEVKKRQENKLVRVDSSQSKISSFMDVQSRGGYREQVQNELVVLEEQTHTNQNENEEKNEGNEEKNEENEENEENKDNEDDDNNEINVNDDNDVMVESSSLSQDLSRFRPEGLQTIPKDRVKVNLQSITQLKQELSKNVHKPLTNIFNNAVYIGIVDESKRLCCFQYDVKLFLCDYSTVLSAFYYQVALEEFCNYGSIKLTAPVYLDTLVDHLRSQFPDLKPNDQVFAPLLRMKDMLDEYFGISIVTLDGRLALTALPMILREIQPVYSKLPYFIYRLGTRVDYENEKECLQGIMTQIALLCVPEPIDPKGSTEPNVPGGTGPREKSYKLGENSKVPRENLEENRDNHKEKHSGAQVSSEEVGSTVDATQGISRVDLLNRSLENVIFPKLKQRFLAPQSLMPHVVQLADLPGLYRVFERC